VNGRLVVLAVCWAWHFVVGAALLCGGGCSRTPREPSTKAAPRESNLAAALSGKPALEASPASRPLGSAASSAPEPPPPPPWLTTGGPNTASSQYGMVSSVEANATRAGVTILAAGGNAVDAAVAVAYALAVTHPSAGNIGGGGFMLIKLRGQPTIALDFRERAPLATTQVVFNRMIRERARGALAAGVPATVAGLQAAHERYGVLSRDQLMKPAIELARQGHALGQRQGQVLAWAWPLLKRDPEARRIFGRGNGQPKRAGERLVQPELAQTLQRIQREGAAGFYKGHSAAALLEAMGRDGGMITQDDLDNVKPRWREPLSINYQGALVEVAPPPSAGGVAVIQMLAMLEQLEAHRLPPGSPESLHLFAEVAKRAHAERRFGVVDPDSVKDYDARARRARWSDPALWLKPFPIDPKHATPAARLHPLYAAAMKELDHTTHFSVADAAGNVVSCTTTLSASFGAKYVVPGLGVVLNNSFAAFGTVGEDVPAPGRRMTSSMSPALVSVQDQPVLILGSPGGDTIPNTVVQVLRNIVDHSMTLSDAIDTPRIHHGFVPDKLRYERSRPPAQSVLAVLRRWGHAIDAPRTSIGDANNIMIRGKTFYGYADPREGGLAAGPEQAPPPPSKASQQGR
jgi:gamma-glutamyltranspeptidase / glutathione hydrolase